MVKVSSSDLLYVLRRFELAGDEHVPRHVERITFSNPSTINTMVNFRFLQDQYYALFDDTAEDSASYVESQVHVTAPDIPGEVLRNPRDGVLTYGMPFKGKDVYLFKVVKLERRLDVELTERYPETSRSTWQKYIKEGYVTVNGTEVRSPKHETSKSDDIAVTIPAKESHIDKELPIVYIDDDVVVVDKPRGVLTHSKGALNDEFTVADFFRRYSTYGIDGNRPGVVHRLDRDTSGVIVGARTPEAASYLQKQFANRTTKKEYVAVVSGVLEPEAAVIDVPIGRNPNAPSTFRVDPNGKSAQTLYTTVKTNGIESIVHLQPKTGRTHQLRVHMKHMNAPIVGDTIYEGTSAERLYLHAKSIELTLPGGERKVFSSDVPDEFMTRV